MVLFPSVTTAENTVDLTADGRWLTFHLRATESSSQPRALARGATAVVGKTAMRKAKQLQPNSLSVLWATDVEFLKAALC